VVHSDSATEPYRSTFALAPRAERIAHAHFLRRRDRAHLGVGVKIILAPPFIIMLYGESRMKYTGWCQNDCNVQG
jgi:hypothetical protein